MFKNEMPISRKCLKEGLPKGMYWLGTMVTGNNLLEQLCPQVFRHFTLPPERAERMSPQAPVLATAVAQVEQFLWSEVLVRRQARVARRH